MLDLLLAVAHHLAVFTFVSLFAMELALVRPGIGGKRLQQLAAIDRAYGSIAGIVIVVGILRVIFGDAGWSYYASNWVFWGKVVLFALTGILSIQPTMAYQRWRRAAETQPDFTPDAASIAGARRFLHIEAAVFLLIPIFAAAMARGFGL